MVGRALIARQFIEEAPRHQDGGQPRRYKRPRSVLGQPVVANLGGQLHHRALGPAIRLELVVQVLADMPVQIRHCSVERLGSRLVRRANQADNLGGCRLTFLGRRECPADFCRPAHRRPCFGFRLSLI
jgi:hypothetical protein